MNRGVISILLSWLIIPLWGQPQFDCHKVTQTLNSFEQRTAMLRTDNPDLVRLHYLFAKDIDQELKNYFDMLIRNVRQCPDLVYYDVLRRYDEVSFAIKLKMDSLDMLKNQTDTLFMKEALHSLLKGEKQEALTWIEKALQHNPHNAEAKVLRCEIFLRTPQYTRCVEFVHDIYNHTSLNYELEKRVSDITATLYNKLYNTGDSLIKNDQAADALHIFTILEEFCHNMPSNYCNDDYYRGILRSKSGVYESYIIIAKVALERKNHESAIRFLEYAEQYRNENLEFIKLSDQTQNEVTIAKIKKAIEMHQNEIKFQNDSTRNNTVENKSNHTSSSLNLYVAIAEPESSSQNSMPQDSIETIITEYRRLVIDAAYFFAISDYEQARTAVVRARQLEECHCFPIDARIALIYNNLNW